MGSGGISIRSIRRSDEDSKINLRLIAMIAVVGICIFVAGRFVMTFSGNVEDMMPGAPVAAAAPITVISTPTVTIEDPTPTAIVEAVFREVEVVVTATPTPAPQIITEYRDVYYETIVEVTRVVEVTPIPLSTATVVPLAPGVVEICLRVEGAREIYIGGGGVVSGGCSTFSFGVGQTTIPVQVNK